MVRAFSENGIEVVLQAESEARAIRNQIASRDRLAQKPQS